MKVSEAQKLLERVEEQLEALREKRRAQRMEYERGLASGKTMYRSGDPRAPFRKTDVEIARMELRRQQLVEALAKAPTTGGESNEEEASTSPEGPAGEEASPPQVAEKGSIENPGDGGPTPPKRKRA